MLRALMEPEHDLFRDTYRRFLAERVVPFHATWEASGIVPRETWHEAGEHGLLGLGVPEAYGGAPVDFRYNVVASEELFKAGATGLGFAVHTDVVAPYLLGLGTTEQRDRWLPRFCTGDLITAIAMTEPGCGSDLAGIQTSAAREDGGWVVNGQKTFITNGINADLIIVVARTNQEATHGGLTLLCVERGMPGFERGRNLDKIGMHAQDTAELFFRDTYVPDANLLGSEGGGFKALMQNLPQERLSIAVSSIAVAEQALDTTIAYCRTRNAFGVPIGSFQYNRFMLAEMATEITVARTFIDRCVQLHLHNGLTAVDAAMAKWWATELEKKVVDRCVQLHGGYGYMSELPIARAYIDARAKTIYGGTTEIMKEVVGRSLGV